MRKCKQFAPTTRRSVLMRPLCLTWWVIWRLQLPTTISGMQYSACTCNSKDFFLCIFMVHSIKNEGSYTEQVCKILYLGIIPTMCTISSLGMTHDAAAPPTLKTLMLSPSNILCRYLICQRILIAPMIIKSLEAIWNFFLGTLVPTYYKFALFKIFRQFRITVVTFEVTG